MKKLSLILAALLTLSLFAACKKTNEDPKTSGDQSSTPTASSSVKNDTEPKGTTEPAKTEPKDTDPPATSDTTPAKTQNTAIPAAKSYDIPKATNAPKIDGTLDEDEWKDALEIILDNTNTIEVFGSGAVCQNGIFRYLWDDSGLYVSMEVTDSVACKTKHVAGNGSYNNYDAVQLAIYTDTNCTALEAGKLFFFSLTPEASDGKPYIGEHFIYSDGNSGKDVPDALIASSKTENGYIIECRIDAAAFAKGNIEIKKGTTLVIANVILDNDNKKQGLFVDTAWSDAPNTNSYNLVG